MDYPASHPDCIATGNRLAERAPSNIEWPFCTAAPPMRLLHTSDWHLGQHFLGKSRQAEHQALIDWLLQQTKALAVDAVLIAGDIFDTGTPPSYARELYNQLVERLHDAKVTLLLLGGNHDSVAVLGESRSLLARLGTIVVPCAEAPEAQVHCLKRRDGTPGALVCAVPFIRPRDVLLSQPGQSAYEKQGALQEAIRHHYAAAYAAALAQREALATPLPIVLTGHLTTVGASTSESVREIYVGALEAFPTSAFPPADYIALGHIHRPQRVGGLAHVRYSGSPLTLSFDECGQQKEMLLVDFAGAAPPTVTPLPVPDFQPLAALTCTLAQAPAALAEAAARGTPARPVWLEVTIVEDDYLNDLPARIQALCDGLPLEALRIRRARGQREAALVSPQLETLDELGPEAVFARRLALEEIDDARQQALHERFRETVAGMGEAAA